MRGFIYKTRIGLTLNSEDSTAELCRREGLAERQIVEGVSGVANWIAALSQYRKAGLFVNWTLARVKADINISL